jgi:hypothetical protein
MDIAIAAAEVKPEPNARTRCGTAPSSEGYCATSRSDWSRACTTPSVGQIESNYSKYITEHSDDHARAALLQLEEEPAAATDNVVPLVR